MYVCNKLWGICWAFVAVGSTQSAASAIKNEVYCQVVGCRRPDVQVFVDVSSLSASHHDFGFGDRGMVFHFMGKYRYWQKVCVRFWIWCRCPDPADSHSAQWETKVCPGGYCNLVADLTDDRWPMTDDQWPMTDDRWPKDPPRKCCNYRCCVERCIVLRRLVCIGVSSVADLLICLSFDPYCVCWEECMGPSLVNWVACRSAGLFLVNCLLKVHPFWCRLIIYLRRNESSTLL